MRHAVPDAVIVRSAGGLRAARSRRLPAAEIDFRVASCSKSPGASAGSAPSTSKDLCDRGCRGRIKQRARAAGRAYILAHPKPLSWSEFGAAALRILGRTPRVFKVPVPTAVYLPSAAQAPSRGRALRKQPGIYLAREDLARRAARRGPAILGPALPKSLAFTAPTGIDTGLAETAACSARSAGWLA